MKKFYNVFSNEKVTTMLSQLTWSHYLLLLSLNNYAEIIYYINISKNNSLTQRQLQEKIKNSEYQRIPFESRNKLIKNVNNYENISEKILQRLILEDIPGFLKELGSGFTFVDNDTVGIIVCKQDNEYVIKYCSDDRIIAREYELV